MPPDSVEYFEILTTKFNYNLIQVSKYNDNGSVHSVGLDFSGAKKGCIQITILTPPTNPRLLEFCDNSNAHINWIGYSDQCSIDGKLKRGTGMHHLINTALSYVVTNFIWIKSFDLNDASKVVCFENQEIDLPIISIALYGKTWYEKHYKAKIKHDGMQKIYKQRLALLESTDEKNKFLFKDFVSAFNVPKKIWIVLKPHYDNAPTFANLFTRLSTAFPDKTALCKFMYPWIESFINYIVSSRVNLLMQTWQFEFNSPEPFTKKQTLKFMNGGGFVARPPMPFPIEAI